MSETERSLADKVAAARDVAYSMSNISGGPMWYIPQPPGKNKASIVLLAALDAQAAEIERLQAERDKFKRHYYAQVKATTRSFEDLQRVRNRLDSAEKEIASEKRELEHWFKRCQTLEELGRKHEELQVALDRSENTSHLLRTQLEGMRQELRDRDSECEQAKKELAEARQEAQEARKAAEWYSFMGSSIDEAQDALQSVYRFFRIATNAMNRDKEPKPETEPGNTFNDCTLIMSDCKEACGQCEALTREEQEQAASMEEVCSKMYQRFINRQ